MALDIKALRNPVYNKPYKVRDPSVCKIDGQYHLFCTKRGDEDWHEPEHWHVGYAITKDFMTFEEAGHLSTAGCASPGDILHWHGKWLIPYQTYPTEPCRLVLAELDYDPDSAIYRRRAERIFLDEARELPWNGRKRLIDPTFVKDGETLHCFFTGSVRIEGGCGHANLLGHAVTTDPRLTDWTLITKDKPLLGMSEDAPDGVENVAVFHNGSSWVMIYSEGLVEQRLALATSQDLYSWHNHGRLMLEEQSWMKDKYGAPFVWKEDDQWVMLLMGDTGGWTSFGLLVSSNGLEWEPLPESPGAWRQIPKGADS